jgi:hypothetical protein
MIREEFVDFMKNTEADIRSGFGEDETMRIIKELFESEEEALENIKKKIGAEVESEYLLMDKQLAEFVNREGWVSEIKSDVREGRIVFFSSGRQVRNTVKIFYSRNDLKEDWITSDHTQAFMGVDRKDLMGYVEIGEIFQDGGSDAESTRS